MLVNFKRGFYHSPTGVYYARGTQDYSGDERELPSDALLMSRDATLPTASVQPMPGFQAKPIHEQRLDLIPGAAPTHEIAAIRGGSTDGGTVIGLANPDAEQRKRDQLENADKQDDEAVQRNAEALEALRATTEAGAEVAREHEERSREIEDPLRNVTLPGSEPASGADTRAATAAQNDSVANVSQEAQANADEPAPEKGSKSGRARAL
jgi:hypothetical protein